MKVKNWEKVSEGWRAMAKFYRAEKERFEWLYKVACHIIHDMDGTLVDEIMEDLDRLWNLKNRLDRRDKNDN